GLLAPGESKTFFGGALNGWLFSDENTFGEAEDYARLVWNEFELSRVTCAGAESQPPVPAPLPLDGEGEIWLDVIVNFEQSSQVPLVQGWNLLTFQGKSVNVAEAFGGHEAEVSAVYLWNPDTGRWDRNFISGPNYVNTLRQFEAGNVYWVQVKQPFTMVFEE